MTTIDIINNYHDLKLIRKIFPSKEIFNFP